MQKLITTIGGKIMEFIPKSMGATGRFRIPKAQLTELAKADETGVAQKIIEGMQNPTLDVAYKAQYNYSVAALNLRDGQKSVARGAVSVVNPGEQATVKARFAVGEKGKEVAQASGFVDASKYPNINDSAASISRRNGIVTSDVRVSDAFGAHVSSDTAKTEELLSQLPKGDKIVKDYREAMTDGATQAGKAMQAVRDVFAGRTPGSSTVKPTFEKVATKVGSTPTVGKTLVKPLEKYTLEDFKELQKVVGYEKELSPQTYQEIIKQIQQLPKNIRDEIATKIHKMKQSGDITLDKLNECFSKINL